MKNLKKMKWFSFVLAGLTLAGLVMPVDAADVSSKSGKAGAVYRISSTPMGRRRTSQADKRMG